MARIISETDMSLAEAQAWISNVLRRVGMTTGERDFVVSLADWHSGMLSVPVIETTGGCKASPVATLHFETIPMPGGGTQVQRWLTGEDVEGQFSAVLKAIMERGAEHLRVQGVEEPREPTKRTLARIHQRRERVKALWLEGKTDDEIAEALDCSRRVVIRDRKALGLTAR
jgi:hypothetical protein